MIRNIACVVVTSVIVATGCASDIPTSGKENTGAARPNAHATQGASPVASRILSSPANPKNAPVSKVTFFDSAIFDQQLSDALAEKKDVVEVKVIEPFTVNQIPPRVDKWLFAVKQGKGKVVAKPEPELATRGIFGAIIDVIVSLFEHLEETATYHPASSYDATIIYGMGGTVSTIVFTKKNSGKSSDALYRSHQRAAVRTVDRMHLPGSRGDGDCAY